MLISDFIFNGTIAYIDGSSPVVRINVSLVVPQ